MNRGIASSVKESTEVNILWATTSMGMAPLALMPAKQDRARTTQMGKPRIAVMAKVINSADAITESPPS